MPKNDATRLRHMLDAAQEAVSFAKGKKREDLDSDRMLVLSLVKSIEIIGEAADHISPAFQCKHPQIPWQDITAMHHRLVHGYYDISLDIVWSTVSGDLPPLIDAVEKILASEPQERV